MLKPSGDVSMSISRSLRFVLCALLLAPLLALAASGAREIDWLELMPPEELKALEQMAGTIDHTGGAADALFTSEKTVAKMNGVRGKLAGYVVPIATNDKNQIVELFLVPYFGACIHVPPPPPNQLVHIKLEKPIAMTQIWDAYYAVGTIRVAKTQNEVATAAYSMNLERLIPIKE